MGAKTIKVVILKDGQVLARSSAVSGFETRESAEQALKAALGQAGLTLTEIDRIVSTGAGRKEAPHINDDITEGGAGAEVVSLIHAKTPKADIAKAVHDAIASRVISMVRRVGVDKDIALIGGVA